MTIAKNLFEYVLHKFYVVHPHLLATTLASRLTHNPVLSSLELSSTEQQHEWAGKGSEVLFGVESAL